MRAANFSPSLDDEVRAMLPPAKYRGLQKFASSGHMTVADVVVEIVNAPGRPLVQCRTIDADGSVTVTECEAPPELIAFALWNKRTGCGLKERL